MGPDRPVRQSGIELQVRNYLKYEPLEPIYVTVARILSRVYSGIKDLTLLIKKAVKKIYRVENQDKINYLVDHIDN